MSVISSTRIDKHSADDHGRRLRPGRHLVSVISSTSLPAGRVVPLVTIPLLREDALRRASLRFSFEAMETTEILMNGMFVRVMAHFVSWLALDRFDGMDALNRSYAGIAVEGLSLVPFTRIDKHSADDHGRRLTTRPSPGERHQLHQDRPAQRRRSRPPSYDQAVTW